MTAKRAPKSDPQRDSELLGSRLRRARVGRGLSLQDVESLTEGSIKTASLSAYELGDTNITALRLQQLAELYDVAVDELLSSIIENERPVPESEEPVRSVGPHVHLDLAQLGEAKGRDAEMVALLVDSIRLRRSSRSGRYFAIRHDDLQAAAAVIGRSMEEVIASLQTAGVLRRPRGRPLGRRTPP
jgi:transcriptional regulator with XRE-family HTH domain